MAPEPEAINNRQIRLRNRVVEAGEATSKASKKILKKAGKPIARGLSVGTPGITAVNPTAGAVSATGLAVSTIVAEELAHDDWRARLEIVIADAEAATNATNRVDAIDREVRSALVVLRNNVERIRAGLEGGSADTYFDWALILVGASSRLANAWASSALSEQAAGSSNMTRVTAPGPSKVLESEVRRASPGK